MIPALRRRAVPALVALATCATALAQDAPPPGVAAGPWVLAPSLVVGYSYDTNVFQEDDEFDPVADHSLVIEPKILATLPFRNSSFALGYSATRYDYGNAFDDAQLEQKGIAKLDLLFSSLDRLVLSADFTFGVAKTEAFDPGGEVTYRGESFRLSHYELDFSRQIPGRPGYRVDLTHNVFRFDEDQTVSFFDYEGTSAFLEYRQPFGSQVWGVVSYAGSRFDHFCSNIDPQGNPCPGRSTPFRTEESDTGIVGIMGNVAKRQSFALRVGSSSFRYDPETGQNFHGTTMEGTMGIPVGGGTNLTIGAARRPFPSFYFNNDYYLVTRGDVRLDHQWPNETIAGIRASYWTSKYPERIVAPGNPADGLIRDDGHVQGEVYANVQLVRRLGIHVSVSHQTRDSNIEGQSFQGTIYFAGLSYGFE
jgi:hypothetical protein